MLRLHPYSEKRVHPGTRQKTYIPYISGKPLHVWWSTKTKADLYARAVLARYYKKLAIHVKITKENQNAELLVTD